MNTKVRIVYDGTIFTSQANGGISRYFRGLIEGMARLRPEWIFDLHILEDGREPAPLPAGQNIRITRRPHLRPGWCWAPVNYANRQFRIRQARPAIVHTTLARPFHLAPCPLVTTIHDTIMEKFPEFYARKYHARAKRWWRWSVENSDAVFTVSRTSRSDILSTWSMDPARVHVTYPGVEENFGRPKREEVATALTKFGIRRPYLLYVGHRDEHKNFRVIATAIKDPSLEELDLVLVGGATEVPELKGWRGLEQGRMHHLSGISDDELCRLYAGAVALVFPSLYEGFGFPLVEAMTSGAPIVASDIPSSREVCDSAAEFFQARNPGECVAAIRRAQSQKKRQSLIEKGFERVKVFTWSSCAHESLRVYERLIQARMTGLSSAHKVVT